MSQTILPEGWVPPKGYANGMVASGKVLFIGGQIGWDPRSSPPKFPATFAEQWEQALSNVCEVLTAAGGKPEQLTRGETTGQSDLRVARVASSAAYATSAGPRSIMITSLLNFTAAPLWILVYASILLVCRLVIEREWMSSVAGALLICFSPSRHVAMPCYSLHMVNELVNI